MTAETRTTQPDRTPLSQEDQAYIRAAVAESAIIGKPSRSKLIETLGRRPGTIASSLSREAKRAGKTLREMHEEAFQMEKARILEERIAHPDHANTQIMEELGLSRHRGLYRKAIRELQSEGKLTFRDSWDTKRAKR